MFVQAENLSYVEQSQNKSIKAVSDRYCRQKLLITGITTDIYSFETCSAKTIAWPCYITKIRRIYREGKKHSQLKFRQRDWKKNETSHIFWGFTETNQLQQRRMGTYPISPSITHPSYGWLSSRHINFKFERAQIEMLLRDVSTIKRFSPYPKGFLFIVQPFENIYNQTTQLNG